MHWKWKLGCIYAIETKSIWKNDVWELFPKPSGVNVIGLKWVNRNKDDGEGNNTINKSRLIAKGYRQEEATDFYEFFELVARLEAITIMWSFTCFKAFKLFQIDVKIAFLNGLFKDEVYVEEPPKFVVPHFPNHV